MIKLDDENFYTVATMNVDARSVCGR